MRSVGHLRIDAGAVRLLIAFSYKREGTGFRRAINPDEERLHQYLAKDTVISISQLKAHVLASSRRNPPLTAEERERALRWLRDLIALQA